MLMASSEACSSDLHALKMTANHSRTIDLSNSLVLSIFLPVSLLLMSGVQVYFSALLGTSEFE